MQADDRCGWWWDPSNFLFQLIGCLLPDTHPQIVFEEAVLGDSIVNYCVLRRRPVFECMRLWMCVWVHALSFCVYMRGCIFMSAHVQSGGRLTSAVPPYELSSLSFGGTVSLVDLKLAGSAGWLAKRPSASWALGYGCTPPSLAILCGSSGLNSVPNTVVTRTLPTELSPLPWTECF